MSMQLNILGKFTEKGLERKKKRKYSFEPDSNQRPKDYNVTTTVLRSTNWAIEGIDARSGHIGKLKSFPSESYENVVWNEEKKEMNFLYRSGSAQKNILLRIQRYFLFFFLFVFWRTLASGMPTSRAQNFSGARSVSWRFFMFSAANEREVYYRYRKREAKDFEKV